MLAHRHDNFLCIVIISYIMDKDRISQFLHIRFLYMMKRASHEQSNHRQVQI